MSPSQSILPSTTTVPSLIPSMSSVPSISDNPTSSVAPTSVPSYVPSARPSDSVCAVQFDTSAVVGFQDDFENNTDTCFSVSHQLDFSENATLTTFLGLFSQERDEKRYEVSGLDAANNYQLQFDLYLIDTWDNETSNEQGGHDRFQITIAGQTIDFGVFAHSSSGATPDKSGTIGGISYLAQSIEGPSPLGFGTGSSETETAFYEEKMRFWLTIPSSIVASPLNIEFDFLFDEVLANEAGGLDNILLVTESPSTCFVQVDGNATTAFSDDFESTRFCFSGGDLESSAQGTPLTTFLGRFSNTRSEATYQFVGLYHSLDTASSYQLQFDMYQIDTLFPEDRFELTVGDETIDFGMFLNSESGANPTKTGTSPSGDISYVAVSLGQPTQLAFGDGITAFQEEIMRFTLDIASTAISSPLQVTFRFSMDEGIDNESAGIDNVVLRKL